MNSARLRLAARFACARPSRLVFAGARLRSALPRCAAASRPCPRGSCAAARWSKRGPSLRWRGQGASLTPESRSVGPAAPRCWAARRGGIGDHPEPRDRMRGLGLARCSPRRDGGNQCNIINLRRVRWRRSNASPNRRLTPGVARNARFPAPPPRERGRRSRIRAIARSRGFSWLAADCRQIRRARVMVATEPTAYPGDLPNQRRFRSDAVRGRPRRRIASEGPRRFTPHATPRGRPALGNR